MPALVFESVERRVKAGVPRTSQGEVVWPSPKSPADGAFCRRTLDAHRGITTRTVGDPVEDPRPTAAIAHEPPVIVASRERRSKGVRRPSRAVRGIPLSNLIAVHASVLRHGPSRSPAGLIIPTVGRDRTIAIDKQVTTVSRTGWTNEKA